MGARSPTKTGMSKNFPKKLILPYILVDVCKCLIIKYLIKLREGEKFDTAK
jgi:hypothetical protein